MQDKLGKNCNKIRYETWCENNMLLIFKKSISGTLFLSTYHMGMVKLGFYIKMKQKFGHMLNCGLVPISKSIPK